MHNAEKPKSSGIGSRYWGQGGLSASSNTRARNSLRAVAPQSAPSGRVHGEVTKPSEPSRQMCRLGDAASRQAVTRVNVEQASKRPMWSLTSH